MPMRALPTAVLVLHALASLAGCEGKIWGPNGAAADPSNDEPTAPAYGPAPLARLSAFEYEQSIADLFPGLELPNVVLPIDATVSGFDNDSNSQSPTPLLIETYRSAAIAIASAAVGQLDAFLPCAPSTPDEELDCAATFIERFGRRVYRRPLTEVESAKLRELYALERAQDSFAASIQLLIEIFLQSPKFLYRLELGSGEAIQDSAVPLTSYEVATRLSYLLWGSPPDETLLDAAAAGALTDAASIETHARRLMADDRARVGVRNFYRQWLEYDALGELVKSEELFPEFNAEVARSMRQSLRAFVDHAVWEEGSLSALLLDSRAFVDDELAPLYGVDSPGGDGQTLVDLDPAERAGLLTQVGFLAAMANETADAPVQRGVFVLDRLLCQRPPPAPADVILDVPPFDPDQPATTRQRIAMTHEQGTCAACHKSIDGVGFAFSHYDAIGQWRVLDNELPVDGSGWLTGTSDVDGEFYGAPELSRLLASSEQVARCVTAHWLSYAYRVPRAELDRELVTALSADFAASGYDLRELLVHVVTSAAFTHRAALQQ